MLVLVLGQFQLIEFHYGLYFHTSLYSGHLWLVAIHWVLLYLMWTIFVFLVSDFIFWGSKITADGDCSHEIKWRLLPGRKVMTNLDSIFKSRDITLPTKVRLVKAMAFPVVMYGCESWIVKKAEPWRIDALNCGIGEDSWESLGLQGDPTNPFWRRSTLGFLCKEWC